MLTEGRAAHQPAFTRILLFWIFLSRGSSSWSADRTANKDWAFYAGVCGISLPVAESKLSLIEREFLYYICFSVLVKHYKPATARAKIAPLAKQFASEGRSWVLLPKVMDGLYKFCGSSDDDRLPLFPEFITAWHGVLDRKNMLDMTYIASDCCAEWALFRRGEYAAKDAFSRKTFEFPVLPRIRFGGQKVLFSDMRPKEIEVYIRSLYADMLADFPKFCADVGWLEWFLPRSKTDYLEIGVWVLIAFVIDFASCGGRALIESWILRLDDGEIFHAGTPILGVRIDGVTVPLDYDFLNTYDDLCAKSLKVEAALRIKGHSRRKGMASAMFAAGIGIGAVRSSGRWSNGTVGVYIKTPNSLKASYQRKTALNVLRNRERHVLPPLLEII